MSGGEVLGMMGIGLSGGYGWVLNLHVSEACRGRGVLKAFLEMAAAHRPLATANVNHAGHGFFRKLGWIRYCDLQRLTCVNPRFADDDVEELVATV